MRQPKQVRWTDERRWDVYEYGGTVGSSQLTHPLELDVKRRPVQGEALRTPRRRVRDDVARCSSAAATLKMYLTDALGERRTHRNGQLAPATSVHEAPLIQKPHSPLSRFMRKREEQTTRPMGLHHGQSRFDILQCDEIHRFPAHLLRESASVVSSTTRAIKERIREAKTLRNERQRNEVEQENASRSAPPLPDLKLSSLPTTRRRTRSTHADQSSDETQHDDTGESAASAPAPHPKPQLPILSSSVNSENVVNHTSNAGGAKQIHSAVRLIQQAWSRYKTHSSSRTIRDKSAECDISSFSLPRPAIISSHTITNMAKPVHCGKDAIASIDVALSRQVETETDILIGAVDEGDPSTLGSAPVMWIDDEWSLLEEGRSTANFNLDGPVPQEEDVEVLAWKQPHVLVQIQEARRLRAVHAGRQQRKKQRENAVMKTFADLSTAKDHKLRPLLIHLHRGRPRSKSTNRRTIPKRPTISVAKRISKQELPSNDDNEVESPFVLFADPEQSSNVDGHNDLIELGPVFNTDPPSECSKAMIFATALSCMDFRQNEADIIPLTPTSGPSVDTVDSECEVTSPSDTQHMTDDVQSNSERHSSEWQPSSSNYVTKPVIQEDSHVDAFFSPVLPSLMEVKIEVKRTLERIQSQYRDSPLESSSDAANSSISTPQLPETAEASLSKQLEFLHVLEEFKQSLRPSSSIVSSASPSEHLWASSTSSLRAIDDADDEELRAMVAEIQQRSSCIHWPPAPHLSSGGA